MAKPKKDGLDRHPTIHAADWREAMRLGGSGVTYVCDDGAMISFGEAVFLPKKEAGA